MGLECSRFDDSVDDDVIEDDETEEVAPQERCSKSALARAKAVSAKHPDALVIVACQIVFANGAVLTKPAKPSMAMEQLRSLSGKTISYFTGLAVVHEASQRFVTAVEVTKVTVSDLNAQEITAYVGSGIAMSKAGGIDISDPIGSLLVGGIQGCYSNCVGFPTRRLYRVLRRDFADLFEAAF